jgi:predicted RNA-binding Zn ribbon-like protein
MTIRMQTSVAIAGPPEDLCLAYANTRCWRGRAVPVEGLSGVADLLAWLAGNAGWPPAALEPLPEAEPAARLFAEALALREAIYAIFRAIAEGRPVTDGDLAVLDGGLMAAPARSRLVRLDGGFGWQVAPAPLSAPLLLAPVLWSAADLAIAAARHGRVRRCANDECLWLFVDMSKTGSRRWCDMSSCGNRAKARRHYQKRTATAALGGA